MTKQLFKDTVRCQANFYLDEYGDAVGRAQFLGNLFDNRPNGAKGQQGFMLYVGEGFVPLAVAVIAWDESDATEAFEQWCLKNGREEELEENTDGEYTYSLVIEPIPWPIVVMPDELIELRERSIP